VEGDREGAEVSNTVEQARRDLVLP